MTRRISLRLASAMVALVVLLWFAMNHFDKTLAKARAFLSSDRSVAAKIGDVNGTTLYKARYFAAGDNAERCFAEYFFWVSGADGGLRDIRVRACGDPVSPSFVWGER